MSNVATLPKRSLVDSMAAKYDMEPTAFVNAIKATVIKGECSNEQFAAFLMVAKEYDLNPLTKEIYAFPDRGGITPIVSIDGWMNLINSHPQFDGMEFTDTTGEDGKLYSVECRMFRKDRARPVSVIEYMSECSRPTEPWKKWPNRMLRHKSAIQCARYAFGFSGIIEPDEYERMVDVSPRPSMADRLPGARQADSGFSSANVEAEIATATVSEATDPAPAETTIEHQSESAELSLVPPEGSADAEEGPAQSPRVGLSSDDRELLRLYADELNGERADYAIEEVRTRFWKGKGLEKGSALATAAGAITDAHRKRVTGDISIDECAQRCREATR
ncbi:MAG: phage recombination protein Bet [Candidatus Kaistia colombiensis]|nr:MAG: phage recombination protein Bet [Kaistia sp.]